MALVEIVLRSSMVLPRRWRRAHCCVIARRRFATGSWRRHLRAVAVLPLSLTLPVWAVPMPRRRQPARGGAPGHGRLIVRAERPAASRVTGWRMRPSAVWARGRRVGLAAIGIGYTGSAGARRDAITTGPWQNVSRELSTLFGLQQQVELVKIDGPAVLATWGLRRPNVLLPAQALTWNDDRAAHRPGPRAGAHPAPRLGGAGRRRARARRFWFNPLFWIACARLRDDGDHACDDTVLGIGITADDTPSISWTSLVPAGRARALRRRCPSPGPQPSNGESPPC